MFDSVFSGVGDGELVAAIEDGARQEAIAAGRRLAAIAELIRRRVDDDDARALWACDPWDSAAAEVAFRPTPSTVVQQLASPSARPTAPC
jgi:hypothetical protein